MALTATIRSIFKKKESAQTDPTKIDRARMEKALSDKPVKLPAGLTNEQKREFILSHR